MFFISNSRQPFHIVNMQSYINYKTSNLILTPTTKDNQTRKLILISHSMRVISFHILSKDPEKKNSFWNQECLNVQQIVFISLWSRFRTDQGTSQRLTIFIKLRQIYSKASYDHVIILKSSQKSDTMPVQKSAMNTH